MVSFKCCFSLLGDSDLEYRHDLHFTHNYVCELQDARCFRHDRGSGEIVAAFCLMWNWTTMSVSVAVTLLTLILLFALRFSPRESGCIGCAIAFRLHRAKNGQWPASIKLIKTNFCLSMTNQPPHYSRGFPQSIKASWYHDALNFYPDASVIPMMLFQMPWCFNKINK